MPNNSSVPIPRKYETTFAKTNAFIESSYGGKLRPNTQKILALMLCVTDQFAKDYVLQELPVTEIAEKLKISPTSLYSELEKNAKEIVSHYINYPQDDGSFTKIPLLKIFDYRSAKKSQNGTAKVRWLWNDVTKPFFLNIDGGVTPYTEFMLENFRELSGRYSLRLYELLNQYKRLGERKFLLPDLYQHMDIPKGSYSKYAAFKQRVLRPSVEEISAFTDLTVGFREDKQGGRSVKAISFYIFKNYENLKRFQEENRPIDIEQSLSMYHDKNEFIAGLKVQFDAHVDKKYEVTVKRISKKELEKHKNNFAGYLAEEKGKWAAERYEERGLEDHSMEALFKPYLLSQVYKTDVHHNFKAFCRDLGHPVTLQKDGEYILERSLLFE